MLQPKTTLAGALMAIDHGRFHIDIVNCKLKIAHKTCPHVQCGEWVEARDGEGSRGRWGTWMELTKINPAGKRSFWWFGVV
jgi:hypothetical protein